MSQEPPAKSSSSARLDAHRRELLGLGGALTIAAPALGSFGTKHDGLGNPNVSIAPLDARVAFGNDAINSTPTWSLTFQTTLHWWEGRPNLDKTKLNWSGRSSASSIASLAPSSEMSTNVHLCRRVSLSKRIHAAVWTFRRGRRRISKLIGNLFTMRPTVGRQIFVFTGKCVAQLKI